MAKVSKTIVDKALRDQVFRDIFDLEDDENLCTVENGTNYCRINDRQWGVLLTDANGEQRYVRIGAIVAELREDMTAEELMRSEINAYQAKQDTKAEKEKAKAEKIAADKKKREAKEVSES